MTGPYGEAAPTYWTAGWRGVLPLPPRRKNNPPDGYTGQDGIDPSRADVQAWIEDKGNGNICLRLPRHIIGIDVDNYGDKAGGATLAALEARFGKLVPTWRSTSRDDGISGISLYLVPEGLHWPGTGGAGIEIIQYRHRYMVTCPSIHPDTGNTYRWITPQGLVSTTIPNPDDLPALPPAWVQGLTNGELAVDTLRNDVSHDEAKAWLDEHGTGEPCRRMGEVSELGACELFNGHGAKHDAALHYTMRVVRLAGHGHPGAAQTLTRLRSAFIDAVTDKRRAGTVRSNAEAAHEWAAMVVGAVGVVTADATGPRGCDCNDPLAGFTFDYPVTGTGALAPVATLKTEPEMAEAPSLEAGMRALVERELIMQRARREATRLLDEEEARAQFRIPPSRFTLREELELPDDPVSYRVEKLWTTGGNVLLTAQYKTGKTTLVGELARALVDDVPFMGRYATHLEPGKRVAIFNYELDPNQYRRWLRELGIKNLERMCVLHLRGFRVPPTQKFAEDFIVDWLAERNVGVWMPDPFARAFTGCGEENSNTDVGAFLDALDVIKSRASVDELAMAAHTGRMEAEEGKERARGATRLDDWPDQRWLLTKDDAERRYFRAHGRDVDEPEELVTYNAEDRSLHIGGWDRKGQKGRDLEDLVIAFIRDNPGCGVNEIEKAVEARGAKVGSILKAAEHAGDIWIKTKGQKKEHFFRRSTVPGGKRHESDI